MLNDTTDIHPVTVKLQARLKSYFGNKRFSDTYMLQSIDELENFSCLHMHDACFAI